MHRIHERYIYPHVADLRSLVSLGIGPPRIKQNKYHVGLGDIRKKGTYSDCWPSTLPFLQRNRSSDRGLIARQTLNAIALRGTNTQRTRVSHIHGTCAKQINKYIYIYTYDHAGHSSLYINLHGVGPLSPASNSWQVNSSPPSYRPLAHFPPSRPLALLFSFSLFWLTPSLLLEHSWRGPAPKWLRVLGFWPGSMTRSSHPATSWPSKACWGRKGREGVGTTRAMRCWAAKRIASLSVLKYGRSCKKHARRAHYIYINRFMNCRSGQPSNRQHGRHESVFRGQAEQTKEPGS